MTKKEVFEIKKQFTAQYCSITKIATGYVSSDKELVMSSINAFLSLPEEEAFKYFDIFKAALSGKKGRTLHDIEFQTIDGGSEAENKWNTLRKSRLSDKELIQGFFEEIIENYDTPDNYLIVLIHGTYDIPGKSTDSSEMFDASEDVYEHILCCICPVTLSKPGLSVNKAKGKVEDRIRDWIVELPLNAILYPAFNDRAEDIHSLLYYTKNEKCRQETFINQMTGLEHTIRSNADEKELFMETLLTSTNGSIDYEVMSEFQENALEVLESSDFDEVKVSPRDLGRLLEDSGVDKEQAEEFIKEMKDAGALYLENLVDKNKVTLKTAEITLKVNPQYLHRLELKNVDDRLCIVFPVDSNLIEINGMTVKGR